jgi:hypothetical protein
MMAKRAHANRVSTSPRTIETATDRSSDSAVASTIADAEPSHDEIAQRAYGIYCERGREHGHDLGDWLDAERELRNRSR